MAPGPCPQTVATSLRSPLRDLRSPQGSGSARQGCSPPGLPVPRPGGRPSSAPLGRARGGKRWAPLVSTFQMSTYGLFVSGMWVVLQPKVFLLWKLIFLEVRQSNLSLSLTLCFQAASWGMRPIAQTWCFCYTSYTQFLEGNVASPLI